VARVKTEAAAEVAAAGARAAELSAQLEGSSEFLQQHEALEGQLAQLRAALAAKTKELEQKLRCAGPAAACGLVAEQPARLQGTQSRAE
jgi:uncharacterized protein involved in exopolysaccharide biosynthesis